MYNIQPTKEGEYISMNRSQECLTIRLHKNCLTETIFTQMISYSYLKPYLKECLKF